MMTSLSSWLLLSALFLGLWGCVWSISVEKKRRRERGDSTPIITASERLRQKATTTLANTAKIGLGVVLGMAAIDLWQYHNTGSAVNAVIESQNGNYVTYYLEHDPLPHKLYSWNFCPGRYLPQFEPRQIVEEMRFIRADHNGHECEDLSPGSAFLRLRRVNGVPVLANEGGQ